MSRRKVTWLVLAAFAVACALAVMHVMRSSVPATPDEIRSAIAAAKPECRDLLRDRLKASIMRAGAVSRRQVETMARMECRISGPQYRATDR